MINLKKTSDISDGLNIMDNQIKSSSNSKIILRIDKNDNKTWYTKLNKNKNNAE